MKYGRNQLLSCNKFYKIGCKHTYVPTIRIIFNVSLVSYFLPYLYKNDEKYTFSFFL